MASESRADNKALWLLKHMETMDVIDAHEHLPPEPMRLAEHVDALTFFRQYTRLVMFSAGLDEATFMRMHSPDVPLDERFAIFERYREWIRASGPARAAYIALKRFYGEDDITRDNYERVTTGMRELYQPGLYRHVLGDVCHIQAVLQNFDPLDYGDPLMKPVPMLGVGGEWEEFPSLAEKIVRGEHGFTSVDEYVDERAERLRRLRGCGAVAFKLGTHLYCEPDRSAAYEVYAQLRQGNRLWLRTAVPNPLWNYITDRLLEVAGELGAPVAVHTGVWGDFRELSPVEMIPRIMRHPGVRFDLFHMGIPYAREMGRIGANFGNVWLNLCWASTISPTMAANALDEWIDQVAANKIIAFGGDVRWPVEKVYGHLVLAKEVVATVLGRRLEQGLLTADQALFLIRRWFLENPRQLYGLS